MKLLTVLGARPQFIKASVVSQALARESDVTEVVVHTGQHFDHNMSEVFFAELAMAAPAHHLGINSGTHGEMTGRMLAALERVMLDERPDAVLVYGDTNSTLAGALAAAKLDLPIAHVEAGLRSFNMAMAEEINRVVTDRISHWLFAPTEAAVQNLAREGTPPGRVERVGDVMYDAALSHAARVTVESDLFVRCGLTSGEYVLCTIHRAENTDDPVRLGAIADALAAFAANLPIVWPVHPRTRAALDRLGRLAGLAERVMLLEPLGYLDMVRLEKYAALIATDSGGVQKEAFFYQVPCVTIRDETEWVELVESGWNRLAPPSDADSIRRAMTGALGTRGAAVKPYGDGDASRRIAARLAGHRRCA